MSKNIFSLVTLYTNLCKYITKFKPYKILVQKVQEQFKTWETSFFFIFCSIFNLTVFFLLLTTRQVTKTSIMYLLSLFFNNVNKKSRLNPIF